MVTGQVTAAREVVFRFDIFDKHSEAHELRVILDTGFDGSLTLPPVLAEAFGLVAANEEAILVGGDEQQLVPTYEATIGWDGQQRSVTVYGLDTHPVIRMRLIYGYDVHFHAVDGGTAALIRL